MKKVKFNLKKEIIPITLVALTIIFSALTYKLLPERVISHWNFYGEADGWSNKNFHAIFFPILILFMYILFLILPSIDPRKERYAEFEKVYKMFKSMMIGVFFIVFISTTLANLGYETNIGKIISVVIGIMMIVLGNYMGKIKNNYFVGIKNPWTLSSENVWNKTHRFGGWTFIFFGLCIIITPYLPILYGTILFTSGILLTVIGTSVYSYILYKKEQKNTKK